MAGSSVGFRKQRPSQSGLPKCRPKPARHKGIAALLFVPLHFLAGLS